MCRMFIDNISMWIIYQCKRMKKIWKIMSFSFVWTDAVCNRQQFWMVDLIFIVKLWRKSSLAWHNDHRQSYQQIHSSPHTKIIICNCIIIIIWWSLGHIIMLTHLKRVLCTMHNQLFRFSIVNGQWQTYNLWKCFQYLHKFIIKIFCPL